MVSELLVALPQWMYVGIAIGALASVGVAAMFLVVSRRYPDTNRNEGSRGSTEERRRKEMRGYLDAIGESYVESETIEGRTVAFYLPDREVAVTFDARTFYALERSRIRPVLVEHEMPGIHLGKRLPFETPEIDFGGGGEDETTHELDPAEAAFAVLGLPAGANAQDVRRAYREKVKEVHPDHGGDESEFRELREAYDAAKRHSS